VAVDISTVSWGVVQDRQGAVRSGVGFTIADATGATVLSGTTNSNGEIAGSLAAGNYTLTVGGVVKPVVVPLSGSGPNTIINTSSSHALQIQNLTTGDSSCEAVDIVSLNDGDTTLGVRGHESGRGTIKVTHVKPDGIADANASALSMVLAPSDVNSEQTAAQGWFLDCPAPGTTGRLVSLRNAGNPKFLVDSDGTTTVYGKLGVNGSTPPAKPTITGSRGGNAALALLLTALASYGLITDGTSA
jgi:hypothetical protein